MLELAHDQPRTDAYCSGEPQDVIAASAQPIEFGLIFRGYDHGRGVSIRLLFFDLFNLDGSTKQSSTSRSAAAAKTRAETARTCSGTGRPT